MEQENELQTNNINTLTAEILILKQQTAQNIIEIGKRLIKVKESLPYGEFGKYLEEKVKFTDRTARRFMRVAKECSERTSMSELEPSKVYALLDVPSEEREDFISTPHEVNGETKTVDEMTTRQLQQAIKDKKEAEAKTLQLEKDKQELQNKLYIAENKEPKTIEVEIDNTDYETINKLKFDLEYQKKQYVIAKEKEELLNEQIKNYEEDSQKYKDLKGQIKSLTKEKDNIGIQIESALSLSGYIYEIDDFLKTKLSPIQYSQAIVQQQNNPTVIKNVIEIIERVENWCQETRKYLPINQQNIINVEEYK